MGALSWILALSAVPHETDTLESGMLPSIRAALGDTQGN